MTEEALELTLLRGGIAPLLDVNGKFPMSGENYSMSRHEAG